MRPILRVPPPPTAFTANWGLTENPVSQGGLIRAGGVTGFYKNPRSIGGKCYAASFVGADYDDCLAHLINHGIGADHYSQCTIYREAGYSTPGNTHETGLYLRHNIGETFVSGYEILMEAQGSFAIVLWEGDSQGADNFVSLSPTGPGTGVLAHGDIIRATIIGNVIRVYKNSVEVATVTDSTIANGSPGIGFFVREEISGDPVVPEHYCMSAWSCGNA